MTKCITHIIEDCDIEDALVNGDQNDFRSGNETDIVYDGEGEFTLRGLKCRRCHETIDIYFVQHEENKKTIVISNDVESDLWWEDPIGSICVEQQRDAYKVFEIKEMVEQSRFIQKCQICGKNINVGNERSSDNIQQHFLKEHPDKETEA